MSSLRRLKNVHTNELIIGLYDPKIRRLYCGSMSCSHWMDSGQRPTGCDFYQLNKGWVYEYFLSLNVEYY